MVGGGGGEKKKKQAKIVYVSRIHARININFNENPGRLCKANSVKIVLPKA